MDAGPSASRGPAKRERTINIRDYINDEKNKTLDAIFIEQQQLYNQYVPLKIDCYGPPLRLMDYYDCFKVFQGPIVREVSDQANSLNITGHFEFHSGLIVKKTLKEDVTTDRTVNGIHVTLDDYVDLLEPFRRSSSLNITGMGEGWKIDEDQSPPPRSLLSWGKSPESPELLRTDGLVKIVKDDGEQKAVHFHQLLMDNIDVFQSFQNKVNIVTGHNLSPALIDEHSLLFIYELLTKQYPGGRNDRLKTIVTELNKTHKDLVDYTMELILDDIDSFGLTSDTYMPQHLKEHVPNSLIPESLLAKSIQQLSSVPTFWSMGFRYLMGAYSCVGITDEDKYKCEKGQDIIRGPSKIRLMESLAFTLTFRVDMVYNKTKYVFSLILDRDELNGVLYTTSKKGVFKQYELYRDIIHNSFQECIVGSLQRFGEAAASKSTKMKANAMKAADTVANNVKAAESAIVELWSKRTFDLIQNGCASIDYCMIPGIGAIPPSLYKSKLVFYTKSKGPSGNIILIKNPFDKVTDLRIISQSKMPMDPVVYVHLHFPEKGEQMKDYLSESPGGGIIDWDKTVNDYDADIIDKILAYDNGSSYDTDTLLSSVAGSLSRSISHSQSRSISNSQLHDSGEVVTSTSTSTSVEPGAPYPGITASEVRRHNVQVDITERIGEFLRKSDGTSTEIPEGDCGASHAQSPKSVGYFTRYKNALVELVKQLFTQPASLSGMGGGGSLHKKPRRSKTRTRRSKKYSRKKARHYNTYVKTRIKRRRRATYKK
jgi:hypothetical protein